MNEGLNKIQPEADTAAFPGRFTGDVIWNRFD